ncbi:YihY/virulence factor BrkB family protein [Rhizobium sp. SSA_523]|uniref:YihY/virulence factor BrkB family protein n=1 Tax=Rhizobium sp. SSA_523 TaxID=2952477 RepID=UPI0020914154|nr:YihY/virulence factor BrkB family protein [Rhizobium sp. SSA_523]MCO5733687.1 YihY/virulence factor BrkB family protein [Rhizobium sp. SSA_523]WKC23022.1 YihY/virulence factor BrkB family protein [Rhizobium sp. SSA_523]
MSDDRPQFRPFRLVFKVFYDAYCHFNDDDGWALASHVALSGLLALFPFLIFGTALAGFLGANSFSDTAVHLLFDTWPTDIAEPLAAEIRRVLEIPRGGLLTISVLAAAYFASNGVEALRISLNRAYRVAEDRAWYVTRLASLGYVIMAVVICAAISIVLVAIPIAIRFTGSHLPWLQNEIEYITNFGLLGTVIVLLLGLIVCHKWLPAGSRRLIDTLPGIALTLICWSAFAWLFASYLATFANYNATYAGLASVMIVLVFLYMVGVIFMLGAEVNAALMKYRVYSALKHARSGRASAKARPVSAAARTPAPAAGAGKGSLEPAPIAADDQRPSISRMSLGE